MRHALRALPLVAGLALASTPALAESVLVLDDTADGFEASVAAETLGFEVVTARNVAGFTVAFDERDDWDVIVVDLARIGFTTQVADRIDAYLSDGGSVIFSYFDMDVNTRARELMDVSCAGGGAYRPLTSTPASGIDVFGYEEVLPSPLNGTSRRADNSDFCSPLGDGIVLASAGADNGIIVSRDGQVIYNAVAPDCFRGVDADDDDIDDVVELYMNEILLALDLQAPDLLVWGDAVPASVAAYAAAYEVEVVTVDTVEALETAITEEEWLAFYVEEQDASAIPAGVVDLFDDLDAAGVPILLFTPTLTSAPAIETAIDLEGGTAVDTAPDLEISDAGFGSVVFLQPNFLGDALAATDDGAGASFGTFTDGGDDWLFLANNDSGAVALVGLDSGGLIVGGFLPSEYGSADLDADTIPEVAEFLANVIDHTRNVGTPVAILSDAGTSIETSLMGAAAAEAGFYPIYYPDGEWFTDGLTTLQFENLSTAIAMIENVETDVTGFFDGFEDDGIAEALDNGVPVIVSAARLDASPDLAAALGVEVGDNITSATAVQKDTTHLGRLFALPGPTPSPLTAAAITTDDAGDELSIADGTFGSIAATFPGGGGAIAVLENGRVIVNGFAPNTAGAADTDSDRTADILQLLRNEIAAVQAPQTLLILDDGPGSSVLAEAAQLAGLAVDIETDATGFVDAFGAGTYQQLAIDSSFGETVQDAAVVAVLEAWAADNGGMSIWYNELSSVDSADLRTLLGISATDAASNRAVVEAADDPTGVFVEPIFVPSPISQRDALGDFGDDITLDGPGDIAATWAFNRGPAATVFVLGGTAAVNGWAPRDLENSDLDVNGIEDRVALIANQFVRVGRVPVPVLEVPDSIDEGTTLASTRPARSTRSTRR